MARFGRVLSAMITPFDENGALDLDEAQRMEQLQNTLKCGTNCGSCLPEVKRMVRLSMPHASAEFTQ